MDPGMWYLISKAAVSGVLVMLISELAKRSPSLAALAASLPLVSVLAMIWMREEGRAPEQIAAHAGATFWLVLPSLPMFLALPLLLRQGMRFYPALLLCCLLTAALYLLTIRLLARFGISL
jgi:uncharacterized membrane protein (GlpM family)